MGNGDEDSGDGWRYRGAGLIQLTGKNNQHAAADYFGIDYAAIGDWLRTPEGAARSAGWFWNVNGLNALADADDLRGITRAINGGYRPRGPARVLRAGKAGARRMIQFAALFASPQRIAIVALGVACAVLTTWALLERSGRLGCKVDVVRLEGEVTRLGQVDLLADKIQTQNTAIDGWKAAAEKQKGVGDVARAAAEKTAAHPAGA